MFYIPFKSFGRYQNQTFFLLRFLTAYIYYFKMIYANNNNNTMIILFDFNFFLIII